MGPDKGKGGLAALLVVGGKKKPSLPADKDEGELEPYGNDDESVEEETAMQAFMDALGGDPKEALSAFKHLLEVARPSSGPEIE